MNEEMKKASWAKQQCFCNSQGVHVGFWTAWLHHA